MGTPDRVVVVSEGLSRLGQRELAMAVRLRTGESAAAVRGEIERLFAQLAGLAEQGRFVGPGGFTQFGGPGFLGSATAGLIYADAGADDPEQPADALRAVLVDGDELRLAQTTCVARVLARLGALTREYPFPATCDRDRPRVTRSGDEQSVLAMLARVHAPDLAVLKVGPTVHLRCRPGARALFAELFERLPDDAAFALLGQPDPTANARLVWFPGQTGPSAITPPGSDGSLVTGSMLLVAPGVEADAVNLHEDGFALLARAETWAAVRAALLAGEPLERGPFADGMHLRVEQVPDGWRVYVPEGGARGTEQLVLLTPEPELAAAVDVAALSEYLNQLIAVLRPLAGVAIRVVLEPDAAPQLAGKGELPQAILDELLAVEPPAVRGAVAFEIHKPGLSSR